MRDSVNFAFCIQDLFIRHKDGNSKITQTVSPLHLMLQLGNKIYVYYMLSPITTTTSQTRSCRENGSSNFHQLPVICDPAIILFFSCSTALIGKSSLRSLQVPNIALSYVTFLPRKVNTYETIMPYYIPICRCYPFGTSILTQHWYHRVLHHVMIITFYVLSPLLRERNKNGKRTPLDKVTTTEVKRKADMHVYVCLVVQLVYVQCYSFFVSEALSITQTNKIYVLPLQDFPPPLKCEYGRERNDDGDERVVTVTNL